MSFNIGHISGGTDAGWRVVKPEPTVWRCACNVDQPRYLVNCTACKARRP